MDRKDWILEVVRCAARAHDSAGMAMVSADDSIGDREILPEAAECTGVFASWCPVHGDCSCPRLDTGEREEEAHDCPLHGAESAHGEEPEPPTMLAPADRVTAEELAEVARLGAAATPGPWIDGDLEAEDEHAVYDGSDGQRGAVAVCCLGAEDSAFIAAARTLLPKLAAEVTALRAERDGTIVDHDRVLDQIDAAFGARFADLGPVPKLSAAAAELDAHEALRAELAKR